MESVLGIDNIPVRQEKPELLDKGQRCYMCLSEIADKANYKSNKDKLNNRVRTICAECKQTTCIKHFTAKCDNCTSKEQ